MDVRPPPLVNQSPVEGGVFAFDNDAFEPQNDMLNYSQFCSRFCHTCSVPSPDSLKELTLKQISKTLLNEPEKILPFRICKKLRPKEIQKWLNAQDENDQRLIGSVPKPLYQEILDAYRVRTEVKASELIRQLKKLQAYCWKSTSVGFETIGFIGAGSSNCWSISRQFFTSDEEASLLPLSLADIDERKVFQEICYIPFNTGSYLNDNHVPTFSSSSYSDNDSYDFFHPEDEDKPFTTSLVKPFSGQNWCTNKENIFLHNIGQYNATQEHGEMSPGNAGIISFALLGDQRRPLAIVIQLAARVEHDAYYESTVYATLKKTPEEMAEAIRTEGQKNLLEIEQKARKLGAEGTFFNRQGVATKELLASPVDVLSEWVVKRRCPADHLQRCFGPLIPEGYDNTPSDF